MNTDRNCLALAPNTLCIELPTHPAYEMFRCKAGDLLCRAQVPACRNELANLAMLALYSEHAQASPWIKKQASKREGVNAE
jgi:hypothetical protein